jgi:hypothetical protein
MDVSHGLPAISNCRFTALINLNAHDFQHLSPKEPIARHRAAPSTKLACFEGRVPYDKRHPMKGQREQAALAKAIVT